MTFVPNLPDSAFRPMPDDVQMPIEPSALRVHRDNRLPVNIMAWDGRGSEIVWRLMVAARLRGRWEAVDASVMLAEILIEYTRGPESRVELGRFYPYNDNANSCVHNFRDTLVNLVKWGYIGRDGNTIWLLPDSIERCQVPERWPDDRLLQF